MLLKYVRDSGGALLISGLTGLFGVLGGIGFLAKEGFKCAVIDPGVSLDFSKINYTEVFQYFLNRNGTLSIPIAINPSVNVASCAPPLIASAAIGVGAGGLFILSHYAYKHRKQHAKQHNPVMNDFTESPTASLLQV